MRKLPLECQSSTLQFADDITQSEADKDVHNVIRKLTETFQQTKSFCVDHELIINANKTQFIIFKAPSRKIEEDLVILLDGCSVSPTDHVKLLGMTLDHHLTFGQHIDSTVRKCHGIICILSHAAPHLPRELLCMAFVALIRTHLEYCSEKMPLHLKPSLANSILSRKLRRVLCVEPHGSVTQHRSLLRLN